MDKKSMLDAMIAHYTGGNKAKFATLLGVSAQTISAWGVRNTFDSELIYTKCIGLSSKWLLTGEGPMLRDSKTSEESKLGGTPNTTPISPTEESLIYKMYKEKDAEVGALKEEIGALKLRIHQLESQDKEPGHSPVIDKATETFTSDSSGDYGEGFSPMKPPTTSKRSSAGKM